MNEMNEPTWAKLTKEQKEMFGFSTYEGEVILIDYKKKYFTAESFYFNAQEYFSPQKLDEFPEFSVWLFIDRSKIV